MSKKSKNGTRKQVGDALFSAGRSRKAGAAYREAHDVFQLLLAGMEPMQVQVYRGNPQIAETLGRISARLVL